MLPQKPRVFISAVTSELSNAREIVARVVRQMGYEAVYQNEFITQPGKLLDYLSRLIDKSELVIHLVGDKYGAEPRQPPEGYERCSYTQFELLYAEKHKKKIVVVECDGPDVRDAAKSAVAASVPVPPVEEPAPSAVAGDEPEDHPDPVMPGRDDPAYGFKELSPQEQAKLQADYRERIKKVGYKREKVATRDRLENVLLLLRDDLRSLWRKYVLSIAAIFLLLLAILGVGVWSIFLNKRGFHDTLEKVGEVKHDVSTVKKGVDDVQKGVDTANTGVVHIETQVDGVQKGVDNIDASLQKPMAGNGRVIAKSEPPGALVLLRGEKGFRLPMQREYRAGTYAFTFNLPGYEPETREVVLQSGEIVNLGTLHLKPLQTPFDENANHTVDEALADPCRFLDRDFWVVTDVRRANDLESYAKFLELGEAGRYRFFKINMLNMTQHSLARVAMNVADKFTAEEQAEEQFLKRHPDVLQKLMGKKPEIDYSDAMKSYAQTMTAKDPRVRLKIRINGERFVPGGMDPQWTSFGGLSEIVGWDFYADKTANSATSPATASVTPAPSAASAEVQRLLHDTDIPRQTADAYKRADAQLNAVYQQYRARLDARGRQQLLDEQRAWLKQLVTYPEGTQRTNFVLQRVGELERRMNASGR